MPRRFHTLELTEKQFQDQVLEAADKLGWYRHHDHDSRKQDWRSDSGFPDLVLAREGKIIFAELKSKRGRVTGEQQCWLNTLRANPNVEVYVWRPDDWPEVERVLKGEALEQANIERPGAEKEAANG